MARTRSLFNRSGASGAARLARDTPGMRPRLPGATAVDLQQTFPGSDVDAAPGGGVASASPTSVAID